MKTFAFIHGWAGGDWLVGDFINEINTAGFSKVSDPKKADVIIAHSAGCYRVPLNNTAKLVMLIGLPYWPEFSLRDRLARNRAASFPKIIESKGRHGLALILLRRASAVILHPGLTYTAIKNHESLEIFEQLKTQKVVLVRNEEDVFCTPEIKDLVKPYSNITYVELPGGHDDYQENPKSYVKLLLKEL